MALNIKMPRTCVLRMFKCFSGALFVFMFYAFASRNIFSYDKKRAVTPSATITHSNEYLEIAVSDYGEFTIGTVLGDIGRATDDEKILLYGHPSPGTSDTLYSIDGSAAQFGLSGTQTQAPVISNNKIVCSWADQNVEITQELGFADVSRGINDAVMIYYKMENLDSVSHDVALRIQMDTMLGSNDGAPFYVPEAGAVTKDKEWWNSEIDSNSEIPLHVVVFDDLANPTVVSQLYLWGLDYRKPDRFVAGYWPASRGNWDYTVDPNRSFLDHDGDGEISGSSPDSDSSLIVWWGEPSSREITLAPGESVEFAICYGISDITIVAWYPFTIAVTAPSRMTYSVTGNYYFYKPAPFLVNAFFLNNAGAAVQNAAVAINLTEDFQLCPGETRVQPIENAAGSGVIDPSETVQTSWYIQTFGRYTGGRRFSITVAAAGLAKIVERGIYVPGIAGAVYGRVSDNCDNPIVGADISVYRSGSLISTLVSQTNGVFIMDNAPLGEYWLEVEAPGYSAARVPAVSSSSELEALAASVVLADSSLVLPSFEVYVYPNPARERYARIAIESTKSASANIEVFNSSGSKIFSEDILTVANGVSEYPWDISETANGVYLYKVEMDGAIKRGKIAVVKYKR